MPVVYGVGPRMRRQTNTSQPRLGRDNVSTCRLADKTGSMWQGTTLPPPHDARVWASFRVKSCCKSGIIMGAGVLSIL